MDLETALAISVTDASSLWTMSEYGCSAGVQVQGFVDSVLTWLKTTSFVSLNQLPDYYNGLHTEIEFRTVVDTLVDSM